jgi:peptidyl-prolyl cis-trans isomerase C
MRRQKPGSELSVMVFKFVSLIALGLLALVGAALAQDQAQGTAEDPVVARIGEGEEVRLSEVQAAVGDLPEQYQQMPFEMIFGPLLDRVIDARLLARAAEEANLDEAPELQAALERARARVLSDALIRDRIEAGMSEDKLRALYEERKQSPDFAREEVHARHILLEDKAAAEAVIKDLAGGSDFAALAEERSTGPSAQNGGDLGYFSRDQMVPEFANAAFNLDVDEVTNEPVQTQFGWHVIKVLDKRTVEPTFEETEPELRQQLAREVVAGLLEDLRQSAEIERFGPDGKPVPEGGAEPGAAEQGDQGQGGEQAPEPQQEPQQSQ